MVIVGRHYFFQKGSRPRIAHFAHSNLTSGEIFLVVVAVHFVLIERLAGFKTCGSSTWESMQSSGPTSPGKSAAV